ncbi:MAG: DUF1573 domain-containing protein [Syntrophomonadaceae bacterium]|jgi:NTP pyrophosphatase (non-canonical NTP hydrolase)|nr:DUF1573 domain-containing protein [Syntrophomonadaceae bacterium]
MKDLLCDEFQNVVKDLLICHSSVLDIMTKLSEATCRVNRAVAKAATDCGCISVQAEKRCIPENVETIKELREHIDNHLRGSLCVKCEDTIMTEMGKMLFYTASLCNALDINLYDVLIKEYKKDSVLGVYNLT